MRTDNTKVAAGLHNYVLWPDRAVTGDEHGSYYFGNFIHTPHFPGLQDKGKALSDLPG